MVDIYGHDVGDDLARGSEHAFHAGIKLEEVKIQPFNSFRECEQSVVHSNFA